MKKPIIIKQAESKDAKILANLNVVVQNVHVNLFPNIFQKANIPEITKIFRKWLNEKDTKAFIVYENNKPIAYMLLKIIKLDENVFMKKRAYINIDHICVDRNKRCQGIAKMLFKEAIKYSKDKKIPQIQLNVWSKNIAAVKAC